ncbi:hypothetical protein I9W82_001777 [Candida metapsilosis]|uniref:Arrestin C-terminal-like domain-containing protein n=1 Tax=Candida metapsilosis TaxID=273372 RepID=A0A8H7ZJD0_9ASCO|nr:hypothetical protein I9W82_001777 [Candida metapsilosis]
MPSTSKIPNSPLFPPSRLSTTANNNREPQQQQQRQNSQSSLQHAPHSSQNRRHHSTSSTSNHQMFLPTLPDKPTTATSSLAAYIIPSEPVLFVQGFEPHEYESRPPTLLRGSLYIRVFKPTKIKSITLSFKGVQRTDWPEGIPPKKNVYNENNDIINHTWPFFQASPTSPPLPNNGADIFIEKNGETHHSSSSPTDDLRSVRSNTPPPHLSHRSSTGGSSIASSSHHHNENFFTRNLSPSFMRRSKSPAPSDTSTTAGFSDLTSIVSPSSNDPNSSMQFVPGDYLYNFEHPLPPSIPETCNVTFGVTSYNLEVSIQRPGAFKSNLSGRLPITIVRTPSELNMEENESIVISRDWEDQIKYDIVIGAKSVVLDSYLPLAFRFVPLFGKVALHRIRIYLTENLEYYCCNKKVHRMEPVKKFLLLEHKARKGRSLLQKNPQDESSVGLDEYDEDILPKELEFQLYVPKSVIGRLNAQIHPDTSYENIQAHHWIKICLRISKMDPENPGKRKHYEISIDSPIHVLSPLAAHNNTLLPAYDDLVDTPPPHGVSLRSPSQNPLSPGVIPVDGNVTQSVEFHHISTDMDAGATERDADMHLEANLYKPKDEHTITTINSPQAKPHPDTFTSPLASPVQRPIHLIRKPSIAPPPFEESTKSPPVMSLHPPAYGDILHPRDSSDNNGSRSLAVGDGRAEASLSLSPLRIDDEVGQHFVNPLSTTTSSTSSGGALTVESSTGLQVNTAAPVRDLLIQQLQGHNGGGSHDASPTQAQEHKPLVDATGPRSSVPEISINGANMNPDENVKEETTEDNHDNAHLSVGARNRSQLSLNEAVVDDDAEGDLGEDPHSPISPRLAPISFTHRRSSSRGAEELPPIDNDLASTSPRKSDSNSTIPLSPLRQPHIPHDSRSRSSSVSTTNSFELPIDQTLPLLNMSTSSFQPSPTRASFADNPRIRASIDTNVHSQDPYFYEGRNSSISSSIYDLSQQRQSQPTMKPMGIISDYMSAHDDDFYKLNSLHHLRNPRIKKHYQDTPRDEVDKEEEEEVEKLGPTSTSHVGNVDVPGQQSSAAANFNNNDDEYDVEEESGSSLSSNEIHRQGQDTRAINSKSHGGGSSGDNQDSKLHDVQEIPPGLKVGYVIDN